MHCHHLVRLQRAIISVDVTGTLRSIVHMRKGQVWGWWRGRMVGISDGRKTRLIIVRGNMNAARFINEVLVSEAIPFHPETCAQHNTNKTMPVRIPI